MKFMLPLFFFAACAGWSQQTESVVRISFIRLKERDTLFTQMLPSETEPLLWRSDSIGKYDAVVCVVSRPTASFSTVVPAQSGSINHYQFTMKLDSLLTLTGNPREFIRYSGNSYLESYGRFQTKLFSMVGEPDTTLLMKTLLSDLEQFDKQFPAAEITGFFLYNMEQNPSADFKAFLDKKERRRWEKLIAKNKGVFITELNRSGPVARMQCASFPPDELHFQSATSLVDPSLLTGYVHVLVFWATWCGPCKPLMADLSALNNSEYGEKPVLFHAVSSESEAKKLFDFFNAHPEYNGLSLFHDSHTCMKQAYAIEHYPTVLIFDKTGKLVARDPAAEEIQTIIDRELAK